MDTGFAEEQELLRTSARRLLADQGRIGTTPEHDVQPYCKRAKASEVAFGDATWNCEGVARLRTA